MGRDRDRAGVDDAGPGAYASPDDTVTLADIAADIDALAADDGGAGGVREDLRAAKRSALALGDRGAVETGVRRLDRRDAVEAFLGCVVVASPLLVEDGIFDIAAYLFGQRIGGVPVFLLVNTAFVVAMTYALVEWTGRERAEASAVLNVVPGRVIMVLVVSFVASAFLMTVWGRTGDWQPPAEAIARVTVLWTVGSLGAALGDILSRDARPSAVGAVENPSSPAAALAPDDRPVASDGSADPSAESEISALVADVHERLASARAATDAEAAVRDLRRVEARLDAALADHAFGDRIRKYTGRDVAEAFVGSVFFAIPLLVEDGVFEVAGYFLSLRVGQFPVFLLVNAAFVLATTHALIYWAGPQNVVPVQPILGVVPRRLVGAPVVAFLTAAMLMTMWGRVDWAATVEAVARVSVVWTAAAFGAALGDVLPGESSGADIHEELSDLGDRIGR